MEKGDLLGGAFKKGPSAPVSDKVDFKKEKKEKVKLSYQEIMSAKEDNAEFRTGKKFMKQRGAAGKIHRKGKTGGQKKSKGKSPGSKSFGSKKAMGGKKFKK